MNMRQVYDDYLWRPGELGEENRLTRVMRHIPSDTRDLLDIGAGLGRNLRLFQRVVPSARLCGVDIAPSVESQLAALGFEGRACDASRQLPYEDGSFDVVVCGEVIEHVIDTDNLLREARRVLRPRGRLILTTPNIAYLPNRFLLLLGIQPLFTETSIRRNLGRRSKWLGQHNPVQYHLKIFTLAAACEILRQNGFVVTSTEGYRWLERGLLGAIDGLLQNIAAVAAGFVIVATPASD